MHTTVLVEFGMEGGGQLVALTSGHDMTVDGG